MSKRELVVRALSLFWIAGTVMFLLGLSVLIVKQQNFPLNFGLVSTRGLTGLWATLLPGIAGLAGAVLVRAQKTLGAGLVLAYSAYWTILLASGIPVVWNAKSSFCLNGLGVCITIPWLGRAAVIGLVAAFAFVGLWSYRMMKGLRISKMQLPGKEPEPQK